MDMRVPAMVICQVAMPRRAYLPVVVEWDPVYDLDVLGLEGFSYGKPRGH
jgi:hypothetical protein